MMLKCTCRFCGGQIDFEESQSEKWIACPHCEYQVLLTTTANLALVDATNLPRPTPSALPPKNARGPRAQRSLAIYIWAVVLLVAIVLFAAWPRDIRQANPVIQARFGFSDKFLIVHNDGSFYWPRLNIILNEEPSSGYRYRLAGLPAGGSITVPLTNFLKHDSEPFKGSSTIITQIWIGSDKLKYKSFRP